jgi:hypothetical protein
MQKPKTKERLGSGPLHGTSTRRSLIALQNLRTATIGSKQMVSAPPALGGSRPAQLGSQRHLAEIDDATADLDRCG